MCPIYMSHSGINVLVFMLSLLSVLSSINGKNLEQRNIEQYQIDRLPMENIPFHLDNLIYNVTPLNASTSFDHYLSQQPVVSPREKVLQRQDRANQLGLIHVVFYTALESVMLAIRPPHYVSPYGPVEKQESPFASPALKRRWFDFLEVLFRSPTIEVEDVIRNHEYCVVLLSILLFIVWIFYRIYCIETSPEFHFDTIKLVPEAIHGKFSKAFEVGLKVLIGDSTSPVTARKSRREKLSFLISILTYCFAVGLVVLLSLYEARPTTVVILFVLLVMVVISRLIQAFHLSQEASEELLCHFTRLEIVQQDEAVAKYPDDDHMMRGSEIDAFQRDCKIAGYISQEKYIKVLLFVSIVNLIVCVSDHIHRVYGDNFREFYANPNTFQIIYKHPVFSCLIDTFINSIMFYISMTIYNIPTLSILTTSGQVQAVTYFVQHFPALTPYAYPGRSPPEPPAESIPRWAGSQRLLLHQITKKLAAVQRPADAFYTCFFFLLMTMLLFSSQTDFFLFNEYGLAITTVALAGSLLLLASIWEGELANKVIHHDQETVFWDAWSRTTLPNVEEKLLTRPDVTTMNEQETISLGGVALTPYTTWVAAVMLIWIWCAIFYQSLRYYDHALQIPIGDD